MLTTQELKDLKTKKELLHFLETHKDGNSLYKKVYDDYLYEEELKKLEDEYSKFLLKSKPEDLFEVVVLSNFNWEPKSETFIKTDIINKNKSTCN